MNIKYKIVEVHEAEHLIVARFYTDILTEEDLVGYRDEDGNIVRCRSDVAITIYDHDLTPDEIDKLIQSYAPAKWLETLERVKLAKPSPALDHIKNKMHIEHEFEHVEAPTPTEEEILAEHIDALLEKLKNA